MLSHIYMHRMNRFQKSRFFDFLIDTDDCICLNWVLIYGSDMIFFKIWIPYIRAVIGHLFFSVRLTSLSMAVSRSIHVAADGNISFFKRLVSFDCTGPSLLCAGSLHLWRVGATLVVVRRLLVALASLPAARGPWSTRSSIVVVHRLGCSTAWGIFLDQGSHPFPLPWLAVS